MTRVAVELPSPRLGRRRRPHDRQVVPPFAQLVEVAVVELGERFIEAHDVARLLQPACAQPGAQQPEGGLALRGRHVQESDAVPEVEALVHPLPPLGVVHRPERSGALWRGEGSEKGLGGGADRRRRDTRRRDAEQARLDLAAGRDATKRIGEAGRLRLQRQPLQHLGRALRRRRRPRLRAHGIERDGDHHRAAHGGVQDQAFHRQSAYVD